MSHYNHELFNPKFRDGVKIHFNENLIEIDYKKQGCCIEISSKNKKDLVNFFDDLSKGRFLSSELESKYVTIRDELYETISELDKLGLLIESEKKLDTPMSGTQLYNEILRFIAPFKEKTPEPLFYKRLIDRTATRNELIGYALEYYHIVKLAPGLIGPALSNVDSKKSQKILQNFFASELHHDRMLEKSLKSVGINDNQLEILQPLPMTFAVCSTLGVLSKQHPLSFKASLFLFEQPYPEFNDAFLERCKDLDLPKEFYRPIIAHSDLNEDGKHDDITRELLDEVPLVSKYDFLSVKRNIAAISEFMALQDREVVNYYSNINNVIPRTGL